MKNGEPSVYGGLTILRNGYAQQQWSGIQMFLAFNIIAVPLVFGMGQTELAKVVISSIGFAMHVVILGATRRASTWIAYFDRRLAKLEELDQESADGMRVMVFTDSGFLRRRASPVASRWLFGVVGIFLAVGWLVLSLAQWFHYLFR